MLVWVKPPGLKMSIPMPVGGGLLDAGNELMLRVALEAEELPAVLAGKLHRPPLDRLERARSIDPRLSGSEQIQVRAIQQQQTGHSGQGTRGSKQATRRNLP